MMLVLLICVGVLGLVVLLLWAPVTVRSSSDGRKRITELRYLGMRFKIKGGKRPKKRKKKRRKRRIFWQPEALLHAWDEFTLADFRALPLFLRDLLGHLNLRVRRLDVRLATPDPAMTGILGGWAYAVAQILPEKWPVHIEPSFTEKSMQICYEAEARVRPVEPLWDVFRLVVRLPLLRLARSWWQLRK